MPPKKAPATAEPTFNQSYEELEGIVSWFDRDDLDLEEGLAKFERGLALAKQCQEKLDQVSRRVEEISAKFGDLAREPKGARLADLPSGNEPEL
jgi:exodeoxyribonuclease VII small subunit